MIQHIDPVQKVCLGVSDLKRSTHYWTTLLGMKVMERNEEKKTTLLGFEDTQVRVVCDFAFMFYSKSLQNISVKSKKNCAVFILFPV